MENLKTVAGGRVHLAHSFEGCGRHGEQTPPLQTGAGGSGHPCISEQNAERPADPGAGFTFKSKRPQCLLLPVKNHLIEV